MKYLAIFIFTIASCKAQESTLSEEISFTNPQKGHEATLSGTLKFQPLGNLRLPTVVFVHGSGQSTRHEYNWLVHRFLENGYAVFQYDKRGVGKSEGIYREVGAVNSDLMFTLLGGDAAAAVNALRKNERVDPNRIILFGGSQAGWIIPVAALKCSAATYVILYGPTVTPGEEIYYSKFAEHGSVSIDAAADSLKYFKGTRGFEPVSVIQKVKQKGLWLYGLEDVSIPAKKSIEILEKVKADYYLPVTITVFPNAGHGLYNVYSHRQEDFMPGVLKWLDENLR